MTSENSTTATLKTAWVVVALLAPVALLNYFDRQMLAAMKTSVMADIPSVGTNAHWGIMLGQFKWVYAVLSPFGGLLADRVSKKWCICVSLLAWSLVTWLTGHVHSYHDLLWTRTAMGVSEAIYMPAGLAMIADYHLSRTRSRAVGVHQSAIYCGIILGGFSGYAADAPGFGWRAAFDVAGLVGIVYAVVLFFFLKDQPRVEGIARALAGSALQLLTNVSFILLVLYFTLPALSGWVVRDWMPAILKDQFHIGQGKAGVSATLYTNIATLGAVALAGYLSDRFVQKNIRARIYVSAVGMLLIVPAMFGLGNAPTLGFAVACLVLFGIGWGCFDCNNMPILSQIVGPGQRATGYGLMNLVSISIGGLADWGFGAMRDRQMPLNLIFGVFSLTLLLSVGLVLCIRPREDFR